MLATLLLEPEKAWYLSDLAQHHGTTVSTLQRELASLVEVGILTRVKNGNRVYFQAAKECPVFKELQGLFVKTSGLLDQVKEALTPLADQIQTAFIYGSVAARTDRGDSDIDVLILGSVSLSEVSQLLKPLERRLSRPVNPSIYPEKEFIAKLREGHHFLTSVLRGPKLFIIGTDGDLATIADLGESKGAPDEQPGD